MPQQLHTHSGAAPRGGLALASVALAALISAGCSREQEATDASAVAGPASGGAHDFMVVANRPNNVHLIDLAERKVVRTCQLPGKYGSGTVVMAPKSSLMMSWRSNPSMRA